MKSLRRRAVIDKFRKVIQSKGMCILNANQGSRSYCFLVEQLMPMEVEVEWRSDAGTDSTSLSLAAWLQVRDPQVTCTEQDNVP